MRVDLGSHALNVEASGSGSPTYLCLHGLVDTVAIWDHLAEPLALRGTVLRVDQRGHGKSGTPPGATGREDLAADVVAVLDSQGIDRAILVGHSMGGIVSMATALEHPDRVSGLVLIGTASRCNEKVAGWYERIARAGETDGCEGLSRAIYGKDSRRRVEGDAAGIAQVTRMLKSLYDDPLTEKLARVECPVLLLVGEKDPMGPRASEIIAENLADATLEVVPDCGHWIHVEAPDVILRALDGWSANR